MLLSQQTDGAPMRLLAIAVVLAVVTSGCLGSEARSEWAFDAVQLDGTGKTGLGVRVAVIDTGINVGHPALEHLVDGDKKNGELIAFRDFLDNQDGVGNARDPNGHGSHVIGIMAARGSSFGDKLTNGGVDLRGASPGIELLVARVCNEDTCDAEAIPQAIQWARAQGADIISLSLGGTGGLDQLFGLVRDDMTAQIQNALDAGILVVAAAGNDQQEGADDVAFPASIEDVIAVGAVNDDLRVASFSQHGDPDRNTCPSNPLLGDGRCSPDQKPEVVAPGTMILSAWTGNSYVRASGTSQATPFVTSALALLLEGKPDLRDRSDVNQIKQVLRNTAKPLADQERPHDDAAGYGLLQAKRALEAYKG